MRRQRLAVKGWDGVTHWVIGGVSCLASGYFTSTVCRWLCTREPAPAGLPVCRDGTNANCVNCIAGEDNGGNT